MFQNRGKKGKQIFQMKLVILGIYLLTVEKPLEINLDSSNIIRS